MRNGTLSWTIHGTTSPVWNENQNEKCQAGNICQHSRSIRKDLQDVSLTAMHYKILDMGSESKSTAKMESQKSHLIHSMNGRFTKPLKEKIKGSRWRPLETKMYTIFFLGEENKTVMWSTGRKLQDGREQLLLCSKQVHIWADHQHSLFHEQLEKPHEKPDWCKEEIKWQTKWNTEVHQPMHIWNLWWQRTPATNKERLHSNPCS